MLKVHIDKKILKELRPCLSSWENYLKHHADFSGDFLEFLALENIPAKDKVWVAVRVLPREIVEVFAIDCAQSATNHAAYSYSAAAAAHAADTATYAYAYAYVAADDAAHAAAHAAAAYAYTAYAYAYVDADTAAYAAYVTERERQLDALAYLAINH